MIGRLVCCFGGMQRFIVHLRSAMTVYLYGIREPLRGRTGRYCCAIQYFFCQSKVIGQNVCRNHSCSMRGINGIEQTFLPHRFQLFDAAAESRQIPSFPMHENAMRLDSIAGDQEAMFPIQQRNAARGMSGDQDNFQLEFTNIENFSFLHGCCFDGSLAAVFVSGEFRSVQILNGELLITADMIGIGMRCDQRDGLVRDRFADRFDIPAKAGIHQNGTVRSNKQERANVSLLNRPNILSDLLKGKIHS